jgi:hypothetical protein
MMRAFGNRDDCAVIDEPYYAAYLARTGLDHPMREAVMASQPTDWREVERTLLGPVPGGHPLFYQKHMSHHMLPDIGRGWMSRCRHAFLIRAPADVLRSYRQRRETVTLEDLGFVQQAALFDAECDRLGCPPPVIDAADVLASPAMFLAALCASLGIDYSEKMLSWPAGPRDTDGVWAPAWYASVEASTGFAPPPPEGALDDTLMPIADAAWPYYVRLAKYRLSL